MSTFAEKAITRSGANKVSLEELLQMLHQEGGLVSAARRAIVRQAIRQLVDETEFSFADEQLQDAADQFHRRDWLLTSFEMN